jgi:hypothetical protein
MIATDVQRNLENIVHRLATFRGSFQADPSYKIAKAYTPATGGWGTRILTLSKNR